MNPNRYISAEEVEHAFNKFKQYLDAVAAKNNIIMYAKTQDKYVSMLNSIYSDCIPQLELLSGNVARRPGLKLEPKSVQSNDLKDVSANQTSEVLETDDVTDIFEDVANFKCVTSSDDSKHTMSAYFNQIEAIAEECIDWPEDLQAAAIFFIRWFKYRYGKSKSESYNPNFYYNPLTIPKWIDVLIIAYGKAYATGQLNSFLDEFETWSLTLRDSERTQYPVFSTAYKLGLNKVENVTPESVVLEHYIKESLYNVRNAAYFDKTSILKMYQCTFSDEPYSKIEKLSKIIPLKKSRKAKQ